MNVIVYGATGQIGRLAVETLLEDGHHVTAFARRPEALGLTNPALCLFAGDALSPQDVSQAMARHEAVVVTLGAGAARKSQIRSEGTRNVIAAMRAQGGRAQGVQAQGVRRLVSQSTLGAHESWANLNFFWKRIMFGLLLRRVHRDHELQEVLVRESGLDWTIVRPSAFADGPAIGRFRIGFGPSERGLALKISRVDIADFLRRQVIAREYFGSAVAISN